MRLRQAVAGVAEAGRRPWALVFLIVFVFVAGVVAGSLAVNALPNSDKSRLGSALDASLSRLSAGQAVPSGASVFYRSLARNLEAGALVWVAGFTLLGIPLVMGVVFFRGFVIGFSAGFLVYERGWAGVPLVAASVAVPNLLAVPALVFLAATAVAFAVHRHRRRLHGLRMIVDRETALYAFLGAGLGGMLALASAADGFAGLWLLRLMSFGK